MTDEKRKLLDRELAGFFCGLAVTGLAVLIFVLGEVSGSQGSSVPPDISHASLDLEAQQGMHFWAAVVAFVGIIQAIVAGGALWFLREDLRQNRATSKEQLRAYVVISEYRPTFSIVEGRINAHVEVTIRNSGQTPAWLDGYSHEWEITSGGTRLSQFRTGSLARRLLGPDCEFAPRLDFDFPTENDEQQVVVRGTIRTRYTDIFGDSASWGIRYSSVVTRTGIENGRDVSNSFCEGLVDTDDRWLTVGGEISN